MLTRSDIVYVWQRQHDAQEVKPRTYLEVLPIGHLQSASPFGTIFITNLPLNFRGWHREESLEIDSQIGNAFAQGILFLWNRFKKVVPFLSILSHSFPYVAPRKLGPKLLYCFSFVNKNFIELRGSLASRLIIPQ